MLAGKLALVTGGGSGIGRAVCRVMAREGAQVVAADLNQTSAGETVADLAGAGEPGHLALAVDVSSGESVKALVAAVQQRYGRPASLVVNCAGITRDAVLTDMSEQAFDQVIAVNLKGTFLVTQLMARAMLEAGVTAGSIVNIASIVGKGGNFGQCNYTASKAGVEGLTRTAAKELGRKGIRCNSILPGFIDTPMVAAVPEKVMEKLLPLIVLRRPGRPEEVAEMAAFLSSDRASYVTGASIEVTGGYGM